MGEESHEMNLKLNIYPSGTSFSIPFRINQTYGSFHFHKKQDGEVGTSFLHLPGMWHPPHVVPSCFLCDIVKVFDHQFKSRC